MRNTLPWALALAALAGCAPSAFLKPETSLVAGGESVPMAPPPGPAASTGSSFGSGFGSSTDPSGGLDLGGAYRPAPAPSGRLQLDRPAAPATGEAPLVGWNGDVVEAPPAGTSVGDAGGGRVLEPAPGGRTTIIELYQAAIDERDALAREAEELRRALELAQASLAASAGSATDLEQRVAALEAENARLAQEQEELGARLATAQIRRLEAEKLLLEAQIRWHRAQPDPLSGSIGAPGSPARRGDH